MKAPEFSAEREWRLIHPGARTKNDLDAAQEPPPPTYTSVEAKGPILRTYFEKRFEPEDLVSVIVGPVHADLNLPIVRRMLEERGYEDTRVETGKVALRILRDDR